MSGETYQVYIGDKLVANKVNQADAARIYWHECSRQPNAPITFVKTQVLATNSAAQAAINSSNN